MEGFLCVPPERNSILGKSPWKTRFVVIGPVSPPLPSEQLSRRPSSNKLQSARKQLKTSSPSVSAIDVSHVAASSLWLQVYKRKGDADCITRYPLASVKYCAVETIMHRKSGPTLPTLILSIDPSAWSNLVGKRRSSQAGTLSISKSRSNTIFFRSCDEEAPTLYDWQQKLLAHINPNLQTPQFDTNFSFGDSNRPSISTSRPQLLHQQLSYQSTASSYAPSALLSPSGSLHSTRSDLSSSASDKKSMFSKVSDLPSPLLDTPLTPLAEGVDPLSQVSPGSPIASSPSTVSREPRETILDRAFMMNCIPGSESETAQGMSSIARFEALMRGIDLKKAVEKKYQENKQEEEALKETLPQASQKALEFVASGYSTPTASKNRIRSRPTSLALPRSSQLASVSPECIERRSSSISTKRQSLSDFTRRVSSTGSLLLSRTHTNSSGSRRSSGFSAHSIADDPEDEVQRLSAAPKRACWDGTAF